MRAPSIAFLLVSGLVACGAGTPAQPAVPSAKEAASVATTTAAAPDPAAAPPASAPSSAPPSATSPAPSSAESASSAPPAEGAAAPSKPKKITARHILIQWMGCQSAAPSVVRTRDQARAVAQDVLRRVKAGEDFPRLVVEFSDEPNAGARGGSLGRFGHGAMVKQFEEAAFALKPGEVSDVVESPFGYHIIQRTE